MEFVSSALSTLLPKLAQLMKDECNLQDAVKKDIKFLSTELEFIHAALENVSKVPIEDLDGQQRIWARHVRDLSYDMENIVDKFILRGPAPGEKFMKKMIKKFTGIPACHGIAKEIEAIKERLRMVDEQRKRNNFDAPTPARTTLYDTRMTALYTNVKLVGIREAMEEVKSLLMLQGDDEQHKRRIVVSIAGLGGLGKTTLAKAVYDEIKGQFRDCTAFVTVSRNPDIHKLLKDMLYDLDRNNEKRGNIPDAKLVEHISEFLKNKRYLIVIDDIWAKEPWEDIRQALFENNMGSRIITTTRKVDVAKHVGGYYSLKQLSHESSKNLFYGRVFGPIDQCPDSFSEISDKILQKCGGVPLAIITMASLLANKPYDIKQWKLVYNNLIGSGLVGSNHDMMNNMKKILLLSYYDLPFHLKTCLLYLSMFPEDYKITKDELIWRWVAEGFVQKQRQDQSFFEIGESYFIELLNRSLIQPASIYELPPKIIDEEGTPEACRVHDTVLDLIISLSKEECFIGTVSGDEKHSLDKFRRISLLGSITRPAMMDDMPKLPKLRSLTIFNPGLVIPSMPSSLSCYPHLRVLDLGVCRLKDLSSLRCVGALSYLRYLGISSRDLSLWRGTDHLPVEIGKLRFLQVLDLSNTMVGELPSSILRLGQLVCLRGCSGWRVGPTMLPGGLKNGNLTSLEVLEWATVKSKQFAEELGYLTRLKVLRVGIHKELMKGGPSNKDDQEHGLRACMEALVASVGKLKRLESLQITTPGTTGPVCLNGSIIEPLDNLQWLRIYEATVLPSWIEASSLPFLSYLNIMVKKERKEDIKVLGMLRCLRHLRFHVNSPVDALERCVVGPHAFPCAERCDFYFPSSSFFRNEKSSIVPSMFPQGAMPRLQHLSTCISLEHFCTSNRRGVALFNVDDDLGLAHLPSLRTVIASLKGKRNVSQEVVKSVEEKLEREAAVHPNKPRIFINVW